MKQFINRLRARAIDHFADNDLWFALAAFCVLAVPVIAVLLY